MENTIRHRNRQPVRAPSAKRTRLFRTNHGPKRIVCLHSQFGFHIGCINGTPIWSHAPQTESLAKLLPSDSIKTATSWSNEEQAKSMLLQQLSLADTRHIKLISVQSDVATSPPPNQIQSPIFMCTVIQCCKLIPECQMTPLPIHMLAPDTPTR